MLMYFGRGEKKRDIFFHSGSSEKWNSAKGKRPLSPSTRYTSSPKQRKLSTSKGLTGKSYTYLII